MSVTRRTAPKRRPGLADRLRESFDRALEWAVDLAETLAARLLTRAEPLTPYMTGDERRALAVERVVEGTPGRSLGRATALVVLGARGAESNPRLLFLPVSSRSIAGGYRVLFAVCSRRRRRSDPGGLLWRVVELDRSGRRRSAQTFPDREQALLAYYL
jgi:hypothetical protein